MAVGVALGTGDKVVTGPELAAIVALNDACADATATVVGDGGSSVAPGVRDGSGVGPTAGRVSRTNVVAPTRITSRAASAAVRICAERGFTSARRAVRARCDTRCYSGPGRRQAEDARVPHRGARAS